MMEMEQPTSPMSVETEQTAPEPKGTRSNVASTDVVATRHLRIVLESITADKNLSEEDKKRKIANFGAVLMANAATKAPPPMNDKQPEMKATAVASAVSSPKQVSSPQSKEDRKMELIRAAVLANEEKRKKKSIPMNEAVEPATPKTVAAPAPMAVISAPQQPEKKKTTAVTVPKPVMQRTASTSSITSPLPQKENSRPDTRKTKNTMSASVIPLGTISTQQPKAINSKKKKSWLMRKIKGKKNRDERRGDFDERDYLSISEVGSEVTFDSRPAYDSYADYNMGVRRNATDDSDNSIGTFEKDYINDMVREQESNFGEEEDALSEGTFEQDARAARALSALSEGTFEQDARAVDVEPESRPSSTFVPRQLSQQGVGGMPNLSETTFEQDAMTRDGDYRNDGEFGMGGSNESIGSETTFERDMRLKAESKAANVPPTQIFEAPSLESVTTFEKEARGRLAVAAISKSFPQLDDNAETNSEDAASDCSDNFRQDFDQDMRPAKPEPQTERETTAATYPMPKISELEMQLSPEKISKSSRGRSFFSKFTCHCA